MTAITTTFGSFDAIYVMFGFLNAAQTYQRFTDQIIPGLNFVNAYVDDFLITLEGENNSANIYKFRPNAWTSTL